MMRTFTVGGFLLTAFATAVCNAQSVDVRAAESIGLFQAFCIQGSGSRERALAVLGTGNALANRLPPATTDALLRQAGTVGWAIRSPGGAQLMLAYGGDNHCEVRIAEADEASILAKYEGLAAAYPRSEIETLKPEPRSENGARLTFRGFRTGTPPAKVTIAITTSDKRVGEQQHLLTFDLS